MGNIDFLTKDYKEKLELEMYIRIFTVIVVVMVLIFYSVFLGIKQVELKIQNNINVKNMKIEQTNNKIKEIELMATKKREVKNHKLIYEILFQKKIRMSNILYSFKQTIPRNVWIKSLVFKGNKITLNGHTSQNKITKQTLFLFEQKLLKNEIYKDATLNFLKLTDEENNISEFQYTLFLK